jgi:tRNA (guanosine-2'-O-)-methyltransferase
VRGGLRSLQPSSSTGLCISTPPAWTLRPRLWQLIAVHHDIDPWIERFGAERVRLALAELLSSERIERIDEVLGKRLSSLTVVVEDTYDPRNAAATMRTAEALGLTDLHVAAPRADFRSKGVTRGTDLWIDVHPWPSFVECATALRAQGFRVFATSPGAREDLSTIDLSGPVAIAFGNEHDGLSQAAIDACDGAVRIPMFGFAESFNLSVSVALVISQLGARKRAALAPAEGDLSPERSARLRARWYGLRQRAVTTILERVLGPL